VKWLKLAAARVGKQDVAQRWVLSHWRASWAYDYAERFD
jgi:hypothetical protein